MSSLRILLIAACLLSGRRLLAGAADAQAPPQAPTVVFKLNWDKGLPWSDYVFTVNENGRPTSTEPATPQRAARTTVSSRISPCRKPACKKIFEWAKAADYFQGQFEAKQKNVAKTGTKTLEFHGPSHRQLDHL